jgi:hypothetical protein
VFGAWPTTPPLDRAAVRPLLEVIADGLLVSDTRSGADEVRS